MAVVEELILTLINTLINNKKTDRVGFVVISRLKGRSCSSLTVQNELNAMPQKSLSTVLAASLNQNLCHSTDYLVLCDLNTKLIALLYLKLCTSLILKKLSDFDFLQKL